MTQIRAAVAQGDAAALRAAAHALKGSTHHFGAPSAEAAARRLEELGTEQRWEPAAAVLAELEQSLVRLAAELEVFLRETA